MLFQSNGYNMKQYTRTLAFLLSVLALASVGCATPKTPAKETEATDPVTETTAPVTEENLLYDNVPALDFKEAEFRILTGIHSTYPVSTYSMKTAEETSEILDDALYKRNLALSERFNITFNETVLPDIFGVNDKLRETVLSQEDAYHLAMQIDRYALAAGMEGSLLSYSELPYVDLTRPYWNQNIQKDFSIDGKLFFTYGDDNLVFFGSTTVLAFNKNMMDTYDLGDPYQLVYDGKWTYDVFFEMSRAVTDNVNGDSEMNAEDQWGAIITGNAFYASFWIQDGLKMVEKDAEDHPYFNVPGNEAMISKMIRLAEDSQKGCWYDLSYRTDWQNQYAGTGHSYNSVMAMFSEGKSLFASASLITIMDARGMEMDFGILPYPTSEEKEAGYIYGSRTFGGFPYVVPITVQNTEMVSAVMEASACASANIVIPVLYDKVLKVKNTRDEDSGRMLDMIRKNRITDLGETYWHDNINAVLANMVATGKADTIASHTEKITKSVNTLLKKATDFFENLE